MEVVPHWYVVHLCPDPKLKAEQKGLDALSATEIELQDLRRQNEALRVENDHLRSGVQADSFRTPTPACRDSSGPPVGASGNEDAQNTGGQPSPFTPTSALAFWRAPPPSWLASGCSHGFADEAWSVANADKSFEDDADTFSLTKDSLLQTARKRVQDLEIWCANLSRILTMIAPDEPWLIDAARKDESSPDAFAAAQALRIEYDDLKEGRDALDQALRLPSSPPCI